MEPLKQLAFLRGLSARLETFLRDRRPAAVVCVDYYGFNRRVLALAKAAGVPAFYFISPQVWASRPGRVGYLKQHVRRMLVIFPFEERLYHEAGVPVTFVGHPLLDLVPPPLAGVRTRARGRPFSGQPHVRAATASAGLLRCLRDPAGTASRYARAALCRRVTTGRGVWRPAGRCDAGARSELSAARQLDVAICSSGTATLENALLGVPMVVIYKLSWPTYAIARAIVTVKQIAMANVLAGREIVPELIQDDATPERVAAEASAILDDPRRAAQMRADLEVATAVAR